MDLATAQAHLAAWLAANLNPAVSVTTSDGKSIRYPSPELIADQITFWQREVTRQTLYSAGATGDLSVRTPKWT